MNGDRLDIVFLIDSTGSMERYMEEIKKQIKDFLNRLVAAGTDFQDDSGRVQR
jgi:Mg-chelatase subunit ChlD